MRDNGYFLAGLEFICCAATMAIWASGGIFPFLFISGLAAGAGLVMAAVTFARRRALAEDMLERIDA